MQFYTILYKIATENRIGFLIWCHPWWAHCVTFLLFFHSPNELQREREAKIPNENSPRSPVDNFVWKMVEILKYAALCAKISSEK